ncbi:MAG: hypothetical protein EBX52_00695 [Proteobacteria bacterium]|nr:hypothetical protein [Pseudomonadota bacterium]
MKDHDGIINLDQFRNRKQEEKKRKTERIFFHHLVGVYSVVNPGKMVQVDLTDVSEEGLGIQVPYDSDKIWPTQTHDIPIRLYFSEDSFMEILVDVKNTRPVIENGSRYIRYGCLVKGEQRSFEAWAKFVSFLKAFAEVSEKDSGNIGVGSL